MYETVYKCPLCGDILDKYILHEEYYNRSSKKRVVEHSETWFCRSVSCKEIFPNDNNKPYWVRSPYCSKSILTEDKLRQGQEKSWICEYANREQIQSRGKRCPDFDEKVCMHRFMDKDGRPDLKTSGGD